MHICSSCGSRWCVGKDDVDGGFASKPQQCPRYRQKRNIVVLSVGTIWLFINVGVNVILMLLPRSNEDYSVPTASSYKEAERSGHEQEVLLSIDDQCNEELINSTLRAVQTEWDRIDNLLSTNFTHARVSGGIFLYPRQASILSGMITHMVKNLEEGQKIRVCETGFGSGHSAALFLSISPKVDVITFDKFDRRYQLPVLRMLQRQYPGGRLSPVVGDTCDTVPTTLPKFDCNFLHGSSLCPRDNLDLVKYSSAKDGIILTSTAMFSLDKDRAVYFGPGAQWRRLRDKDCIRSVICYEEEPAVLERQFVFNQNVGSHFSHRFCIGVSTGFCAKASMSRNLTDGQQGARPSAAETIMLDQMCPKWMVPVPA